VDILEIAKGSSHKTRIMYRANLSYGLLRKYLGSLTRSGLLDVREQGKRLFVTTKKGRRFVEEFQELLHHSEIAEAKRRALERELGQVGRRV
jgi:predicted transcriptional regulator